MTDAYADAKAMWREHSLQIVRTKAPSTASQRAIAWRFLKKHGLVDKVETLRELA
jgi:hypothetical protein